MVYLPGEISEFRIFGLNQVSHEMQKKNCANTIKFACYASLWYRCVSTRICQMTQSQTYRRSDLAPCRLPTALLTTTWLVLHVLLVGVQSLTFISDWSWWIDSPRETLRIIKENCTSSLKIFLGAYKVSDLDILNSFLDVDALWSVQTSGPIDTKQTLVTSEP